MSGGFIKPQKHGEHQVVHFTFVGPLDRGKAEKWNEALAELKQTFGDGLTGITIKGDPTPPKYLRLARKRKK
jgi:hypothetical protein